MSEYPVVINELNEEVSYGDYRCILLIKEYNDPPLRFSGEIFEIYYGKERLKLTVSDIVALPGDSVESVRESCREHFLIWLSKNTEEEVFWQKQ